MTDIRIIVPLGVQVQPVPGSPGTSPTLFQDYGANDFAGEAGALAVNDNWASTIYDYVPRFAPEVTVPQYTGAGDEVIVTSRSELSSALNNGSITKVFCQKGSDLTNGSDNDALTLTLSGTSGTPRWFIYYDPADPDAAETIAPWNQAQVDRVNMPFINHNGSWTNWVGLSWGIVGTQQMRMAVLENGADNNLFYRCNCENAVAHGLMVRGDDNVIYQCVSHDHTAGNSDIHCFVFLGGDNCRVVSCEGWDFKGDFFHVEEQGSDGLIIEDCDIYRETFYDGSGNIDPGGEYGDGEGAVDVKNLNPNGTATFKVYGNRIWAMRIMDPTTQPGGGSGAPIRFSPPTNYTKDLMDCRWNVIHDCADAGINLKSISLTASDNHSVVRNILSDIRTDSSQDGVLYTPNQTTEVYLNTVTDALSSQYLSRYFRSDLSDVVTHDNMGNFFQDVTTVTDQSLWGSAFHFGYNAWAGTYTTANDTYPVGYEAPTKSALNMGNFTYRRKKLTAPETHTINGIVPTSSTPSGFRTLVPTSGPDQIGSRAGIGVEIPGQIDDPDIIVRADGGGDYTTIQAAVNASIAGEIIEIQANTEGGTQTFNEYVTLTQTASEGNERTLRVRDGDRVNLYPTATSSNAVLRLTGATYWIIDGDLGDFYIGNRALWNGTGGGSDTYPYNAVFRSTNNSHHFDVRGVHFSGAEGTQAVEPDKTSHHYRFIRCTGYGHGRVTDVGGSGGTYTADGIRIVGNNAIVQDCDLSAPFGGHNSAMLFGNQMVVRNNTFYMNWPDYTDQSSNSGYRAFAVSLENDQPDYASVSPWGPALIEDNLIRRAGHVSDSNESKNANYKLAKRRTIFRYNYVFDCLGDQSSTENELLPDPHGEQNNTEFVNNYHNTYDNNVNVYYRSSGRFDSNNNTNQNAQGNVHVNNIYSNITAAAVSPPVTSSPYAIYLRDSQRYNLQGYPDAWLGMIWKGNMFDVDDFRVFLQDSLRGNETITGLANMKTEWPNVFLASNNTNAPTYVNASLKTKAGFALQSGSNGEDEAVAMTTVTANSSGAIVEVDDAYWIYDGFDLSYFGEEGDYIAFYDSTGTTLKGIRQVSSVNSQINITLTSSISLVSGDTVYAVLSDGTTVCRNMGAAQ